MSNQDVYRSDIYRYKTTTTTTTTTKHVIFTTDQSRSKYKWQLIECVRGWDGWPDEFVGEGWGGGGGKEVEYLTGGAVQ